MHKRIKSFNSKCKYFNGFNVLVTLFTASFYLAVEQQSMVFYFILLHEAPKTFYKSKLTEILFIYHFNHIPSKHSEYERF